jgi:hypothetical protein
VPQQVHTTRQYSPAPHVIVPHSTEPASVGAGASLIDASVGPPSVGPEQHPQGAVHASPGGGGGAQPTVLQSMAPSVLPPSPAGRSREHAASNAKTQTRQAK